MSKRHHNQGRWDAESGNPPSPPHEKGVVEELIFGQSSQNLQDRADYMNAYDKHKG